jgi:hypothetical protein
LGYIVFDKISADSGLKSRKSKVHFSDPVLNNGAKFNYKIPRANIGMDFYVNAV